MSAENINNPNALKCINIFHTRYCEQVIYKRFIFFTAKIFFLSITVFFVSQTKVHSQTPAIDSLKRSLFDTQADKLSILFELCRHGESMPADTLMMFAEEAKQLSIQNKDNNSLLQSEFFIARSYTLKSKPDSTLQICNQGLQQVKDTNSMFTLYYQFMWYKIVALTKMRRLKESIDACFTLLEKGEKYNNLPAQVIAYNNLGVNYNILGNHTEALNWFNKAYALIKDDSLYKKFPLVFTNLSALYFFKNQNDSGNYFLRKALRIAKETQSLRSEADCYTLQGLFYAELNKMDSAGQMLQEAVALQKQIGDIQFILVGINALQAFYAKQKNYPKAIEYIKQAEAYSKKFHEPISILLYVDLASYYKQMKNYTAYGETMDTIMLLKDSMYLKSKAKDLAKLEAQYDVTSKEAFIARQKLELLHKDLWIGIVALLTLITAVLAYLLYRRNRRRQRTALTQAEEKERRRIAADLHDNIGAYASAISAAVDEIESKKLITDASSIHYLKSNATEIISALRDTIWAFNKESITLTDISDRIKIYTQKMQPSYPLVNIKVEENINSEKNLSPVQALHIFRIVQEALHNALQHSRCSNILISIISNIEVTLISIKDNGKGFDPANVIHEGNGLMNMKSRAKEAGFDVSFNKVYPEGTNVELITAINKQVKK